MKKNRGEKESPKGKGEPLAVDKQVQLLYKSPESMRFVFSNNMIVQFDGTSFFLTFYETTPPMVMGSEQEVREQIEALETLPAYAVAKVVIPADKMGKFVAVLNQNFKSNMDQKSGEEDASGSEGKKPK